jgi:death on curing protein
MNETPCWQWIDREVLLILHDESLAEHGGGIGIRDEGLLDSALARPLNTLAYGQADVADLAASYGFYLVKKYSFVDGNKRAAFLAVGLFLYLNGYRLTVSQADATLAILALAAGEIDEAQLAQWIRSHSRTAQ